MAALMTDGEQAVAVAPAHRVVVIGASAGGIEALRAILKALPQTFPAPIVIVQHRSPTRASLLRSVLAFDSKLPVVDAKAGESLSPGTVYVSRADLHLTVTSARQFAYVDGHPIRFVLSSANPLFESAARVYGNGAIGVVLSGGGTDATDGVQAVRTHGGIVIAQDERTSRVFGMPSSAIRSGAVNYVLPIEEIGPMLTRLVNVRPETA
jgi:two-component system chemotaxis response regulator CheB